MTNLHTTALALIEAGEKALSDTGPIYQDRSGNIRSNKSIEAFEKAASPEAVIALARGYIRMEAALRPFAEAADYYDDMGYPSDAWPTSEGADDIRLSHLRQARAALQPTPKE
jgi:hypothetical protein